MHAWKALALAALTVSFVLAGCAEPAQTASSSAAPEILVDANRPATEFGRVDAGPGAGPDLNATTAAPPRLVEGEWWRIQFSQDDFSAVDEVVRVVANATSEGYIFGMPHGGWFKEAIAYHAPAFGDVGLDLSYMTHNERFQPVRFPLVQGDSWETTFATAKMVATVESADEHTAVIRLDSPPADPQPTDPVYAALGLAFSGTMRLTYDARQHEVVEMQSGFGSWKVVDHGYAFKGWVTVPRGEHTAIDYGTFGPASPDQPVLTRSIDVDGQFNRMTLMHVIVPLAPGVYHIKSTAPNGTVFLTETTGNEGMVARFYEASDPDGAWTQEDLVGGAAATYSMGIAYHQFDINLPGGQRRTDHSHPVVR